MPRLSSRKVPSDCEAQCPDCGKTLSRLADMNRHRTSRHPDGTETKYPCPSVGCQYETTHKGNLRSHIDARHSDGPKYKCPESGCSRRFTDAAALIRHRKTLHGYVPYHTKEYIARKAAKRKERVVQRVRKTVSNTSPHQQALPNASSSVPPPAPIFPESTYWKMPVDTTRLYTPQSLPSQASPSTIQDFLSASPSFPNTSSSVPPPAPIFPESAYWKMLVDTTRLYNPQSPLSQASPSTIQDFLSASPSFPNTSSSVLPPAPKLPETAYHDDFWKIPVDIPRLYTPQLLPSQASPLSLPFETWPGCNTPSTIQNFPSASSSPPSIIPSDFAIDDLLGPQLYATQPQIYTTQPQLSTPQPQFSTPQPQDPQLYTTQSVEQQFGESLTWDHDITQGLPCYNGNEQWNWPL